MFISDLYSIIRIRNPIPQYTVPHLAIKHPFILIFLCLKNGHGNHMEGIKKIIAAPEPYMPVKAFPLTRLGSSLVFFFSRAWRKVLTIWTVSENDHFYFFLSKELARIIWFGLRLKNSPILQIGVWCWMLYSGGINCFSLLDWVMRKLD